MNWTDLKKGQEVRFRALGGWIRGHVSEVYQDSASVAHSRGSQLFNTRVYDIRNITPWQSEKAKNQSTSPDAPLFD